MTDEEKIKAVTAKLLRKFYPGAIVLTKKGRMCEVRRVRDCATGGQWVRVKFMMSKTGNWEYHSEELTFA